MTHTDIAGLIARFPLLEPLIALTPVTWFNPGATSLAEGLPHVGLTRHDVAAVPIHPEPQPAQEHVHRAPVFGRLLDLEDIARAEIFDCGHMTDHRAVG